MLPGGSAFKRVRLLVLIAQATGCLPGLRRRTDCDFTSSKGPLKNKQEDGSIIISCGISFFIVLFDKLKCKHPINIHY
ncbi:hypothetical protein T03_4828 [Trichinella britovi]|uniref:Uncharacterized protein n=2 Tax=Trichinella TaxID=6333 RepID=A0A0V1CY22_TRIBR|nr:hypothetical protein T06_4412 [Trichinella sp. T6]KRY39284.1 hypothetical protein T01_5213 [Trichinella spiralis]KRY54125.1 hypothetical protein T03_4828 [Trichinella britovi]